MIRVSQNMLFSRYVTNMNTSLSDLLDLNIKSQTQKRVIRPSDDPTGMTRILDHRDVIRSLEQYKENVDTAKGWLGRSDSTMLQASTLLTRAKELAEQAATGTLTADNREEISYELRSIFDQMVGLANTKFEGKSIYAGHKTDSNAFEKVMWMTTNDADLNANNTFRVEGTSNTTVLVQFIDTTGATAVGDTMALNDPNLGIRYSTDGGDTWQTDGAINFAGGEARLLMPSSGTSVVFNQNSNVRINDSNNANDSRGTWLWLRNSARYLGDDVDSVKVDAMGNGTSVYNASASGAFPSGGAMVRIDNTSAVAFDEEIEYSFSIDGGLTWKTGNRAYADATASNAVLSIQPGGVLTLTSNGGNTLQPGTQFVIRARTAAINLDISETERVQVNDIGKEIFGGIFQDPDVVLSNGGNTVILGSSNASPVFYNSTDQGGMLLASNSGTTKNIFEVLGNLIAFTETNNQTGVQQMLASLEVAHEHLMNATASVGGRENRLTVANTILDGLELNEKELLSNVEDADISELMTDLAQKKIVYESVLRSTSMIMQLNLSKFI
ncbi:flagellar hook-associated protein FlgL [Salidesulfovibrio onnuriiensis]|uniref:flagellar hook-associated protein FlgL n=1 Tax=Salidesulfovibrio onnuriiensis TaxID=2583823 RepID=UPI00202B9170|nr:flagellar hook-associated protein FlgL [Salidesulfovibrio onnuriiensis]